MGSGSEIDFALLCSVSAKGFALGFFIGLLGVLVRQVRKGFRMLLSVPGIGG